MSDLDSGEVRVAFAEDAVHFFKRASRSLGVEKVDDREDESIARECQPSIGTYDSSKWHT